MAPAISVGNGLPGISATGFAPPDPNAAIDNTGTILDTVNSTIQEIIPGQGVTSITFNSFLGIPTSTLLFDPHVVYDPLDHHMIMVVADGATHFLMVNPTNSATGNYCEYPISTWSSSDLGDFPLLGVDGNNIYLTTDLFDKTNDFVGSQVETIPKAGPESCAPNITFNTFSNLFDPGAPGQLAFTIAPQIAYTFTNTGRFVDTYAGGGTHITMWTYDGTNLTGVDIPVTFYDATTPATQQGTSVKLDPGDSRVYQLVYNDGLLTFAMAGEFLWSLTQLNDIVQVYEIDPTTETQKGFTSFGTPGQDYTYPAAVMLDSGSVLVSYSVSSANLFPSIGAIEVNPDMSLSAQQQVQFGNGFEDEAPGECAGCARYGDFASAVLDPNNHQVAWVDNEYTTANNQWNTWINPITG